MQEATTAEGKTRIEPPKNRPIWITANVMLFDGICTSAEPYIGYAQWDEKSGDWLDRRGMSIRMNYEAELFVLDWIELEERARNCPIEETDLHASIYHWSIEGLSPGFYVSLDLKHSPTGITLRQHRNIEPFASQAEAAAIAIKFLADPTVAILEGTQSE